MTHPNHSILTLDRYNQILNFQFISPSYDTAEFEPPTYHAGMDIIINQQLDWYNHFFQIYKFNEYGLTWK